jgi:hypothetical protein
MYMNSQSTKSLISVSILFLFLVQTGCYSYPPYSIVYEVNQPYTGSYPFQYYGPDYSNGYGQPAYSGDYGQNDYGQGYQRQDDYGPGYQENEDDGNVDYRAESYGQNRPWQDKPYGSDYGRQ